MNKQNITIWGRELFLNITYDCYPGEAILDTQKEALQRILAVPAVIEESLKSVENYIMKDNAETVGNVIDNIFKYVMPKSLFVPRDNEHMSVAVICDYKFDPEHGLAVVFEDEKLKAIGSQDIIL